MNFNYAGMHFLGWITKTKDNQILLTAATFESHYLGLLSAFLNCE
jgi:hypothetical protein